MVPSFRWATNTNLNTYTKHQLKLKTTHYCFSQPFSSVPAAAADGPASAACILLCTQVTEAVEMIRLGLANAVHKDHVEDLQFK